jgi:hypothetical protein
MLMACSLEAATCYQCLEIRTEQKKSEVADPVDFQKIQKKSVKFTKIRLNHV